MRQLGYVLLMAGILSGCDLIEGEEKRGGVDNDRDVQEDGIRTSNHSVSMPDTTSWITLIERTTGGSFNSGYTACARLTMSPRDNETTEQDAVVNNAASDRPKFMNYRYTVPAKSASVISAQLGILHKEGFLDVDVTTINGQPSYSYRLTKKGWGEAPVKSSFSHSLCYETGRWRVSKILDYNLLDDQGSGVEVYKVKYEIDYQLKGWVTEEFLETFKQQRVTPKQSEAILVKGPVGYFNVNSSRGRGIYQNVTMPNPGEATRIVRGSNDFIASLCRFENHIQKKSGIDCINDDVLSIRKSMVVHNVGVPRSGNMTTFKLTFTTRSGADRYVEGSLIYSETVGWFVDGSFTFY